MTTIKKTHPNKGKTFEQIMEVREERSKAERHAALVRQYEPEETRIARRDAELKENKEDEYAIFALLFSYGPENPYSWAKFSGGLDVIRSEKFKEK